jgi:hypothetical protein
MVLVITDHLYLRAGCHKEGPASTTTLPPPTIVYDGKRGQRNGRRGAGVGGHYGADLGVRPFQSRERHQEGKWRSGRFIEGGGAVGVRSGAVWEMTQFDGSET